MAATAVTLNDLRGHAQVAGLFKCTPSDICAAFYTISTDTVLVRFLCISTASCCSKFSDHDTSILVSSTLYNKRAFACFRDVDLNTDLSPRKLDLESGT